MLKALTTHRTITGAADALALTQPAVSKLLASLEAELGLLLFVRGARGCVPTPEAEALLPLVDKLLDDTHAIQRAAWDLREGDRGSMSLVTNPALANSYVPSLLARFNAHQPGAQVSLRVQPARLIPQFVASRQCDLGIVLFPERNSEMAVDPLPAGTLVCAVPVGHRLAERPVLGVRDLRTEAVISFQRFLNYGRLTARLFEDHGVPFAPVIQVETSAAACALARKKLGIAIVDDFTARDYPDLLVRPLLDSPRIDIGFVRPRHWPLSRIARRFIDVVTQHVER